MIVEHVARACEQLEVIYWTSKGALFKGLKGAKIMFASLGIKFESLIVTAEIVTTDSGNNFMVEVETRRR